MWCLAVEQLTRTPHRSRHCNRYWLCMGHERNGCAAVQRRWQRSGSEEENYMLEMRKTWIEVGPWSRSVERETGDLEIKREAGSKGPRRVPETVDIRGRELMIK